MVTIYDIAKRLGVSPPTVSKALNNQPDISEETKKRVRQLAEELGYTPNSSARGLITKKTWLIGMIYEEDHLGVGVEHPLFSGIMNAFKNKIEQEGYELLFISKNLGDQQLSYLEHCRYRRVDGVLVLNGNSENLEIKRVIHSSIPVVSANIVFPNVCTVTSDNVTPSREVVRYLYNLGHRRIAHISGPLDYYASAAVERLEGYKLGLKDVGLDYDPALVIHATHWNVTGGYRAMESFLHAQVPFTAIYCGGDVLALGVMKYCQDHGISIPEAFSLVGFDDYEWASYSHPPLTTFRQNRKAIGETAAESLIKKINGETLPPRIVLPVEFIERQSCKKI
ncbi:MAG: LacI family transcriptional regulator [Treponemataceae bacterium]|nr:LacI family transcriptional regulator [Treponemataceae bacterium]